MGQSWQEGMRRPASDRVRGTVTFSKGAPEKVTVPFDQARLMPHSLILFSSVL
jgi:hypothetical protein